MKKFLIPVLSILLVILYVEAKTRTEFLNSSDPFAPMFDGNKLRPEFKRQAEELQKFKESPEGRLLALEKRVLILEGWINEVSQDHFNQIQQLRTDLGK
jgi:hypothetical protein